MENKSKLKYYLGLNDPETEKNQLGKMTLTYSMVLERLDVVNEREKQIRKFYKPLPASQIDAQRPWPRRHRFADVMEPGDVVKTMSKNKADWDPDGEDQDDDDDVSHNPGVLNNNEAHETFEPATRPPPRIAPSENQPLMGYVSKVERKLKKSIEMDVEERRKSLRAQLQKEMKGSDDGHDADNLEPLFKPARTTAATRKRLDINSFCTDPASTRVRDVCFDNMPKTQL